MLAVMLISLMCADVCRAQTATATAAAPAKPVAATYLYIEPYETRMEALFGAEMLLGWIGESPDPAAALTPEAQLEIGKKVASKADRWCAVRDDGNTAKGRLVSVSFVKGEPGRTEPVKAGESVAPKDCMIGIMWEFATSPVPRTIEALWWEWNPPINSLPIKLFFGTQTDNLEMTRDLNFAKWQNEGRLPPPKPLAEVPPLPPVTYIPIPIATAIWLLIGVVYYVLRNRTDRKPRGGWLGMLIAWVFVAVILSLMGVVHVRNPTDKIATPVKTADDAVRIARPLLRNIYRAFDYQTESQIYDSLKRSVEGELLRKVYLEMIQSLAIDGGEGARARVTDVDVQIDKVTQGDGLTFTTEGQWTALGTVGHWGHTHTRVNRYNARVTFRPVDSEWKITGLEVLELRRM